jgi:hypothetical protein
MSKPKLRKKVIVKSWALMAHACNPSYSQGGDQEDLSLKPVQVNSLQDPILKTANT